MTQEMKYVFMQATRKMPKVVGQERAVGRCLRAGDVNHAPGGRSVDGAGAVNFRHTPDDASLSRFGNFPRSHGDKCRQPAELDLLAGAI